MENPGVDGRINILHLYRAFRFIVQNKKVRIILKWIFRKWDVGVWTGSSWLRIGTGGGLL